MISRTTRSAKAALHPLLSWRPGVHDLAEIMLLAVALPIYYLVRGVTVTQVDEAIARGADIINMEKSLGIFWEVELQSWILSYQWLVKLLNWFYLFGHLPVIGTLAVWLYFWHRPQYLLMRNAFLLSGAIALIFYVNFPTAPPRLLPEGLGFGFVDTVVQQYQQSRPLTPSWFVNEYAAMPSMHIGWNLLVGISIWLASRNIFVRAFAVLMPLAMLIDIILTANHYILDAAAGLGVMLIGLGIALAARWLVMRAFSAESKAERKKGWASWLCWLCGVAPSEQQPERLTRPA
ncbi:MAG: phosphatase PAP2 family protein [Dehalococcoidia bacterium]|nr:phosphatase PAP2 family protein [Dehalococcoidia bacterium]